MAKSFANNGEMRNNDVDKDVEEIVRSLEETVVEEDVVKDLEESVSVKQQGNELYSEAKYSDAIEKYELAIRLCPEEEKEHLAKCYGNLSACYLKMEMLEKVVEMSSLAIENDDNYMKAYLRRGNASEQLNHLGQAFDDLKKVLELDPSNTTLRARLPDLERRQKEQQEKQTAEALSQLKELGNKFLGNFGINLDNFKAVQDPNTGSYSVSYQP